MSVVMESYTRVKDAEAARESVLRERNDSHAIVKRLARQRWKASMADTLAGLHKDAALADAKAATAANNDAGGASRTSVVPVE